MSSSTVRGKGGVKVTHLPNELIDIILQTFVSKPQPDGQFPDTNQVSCDSSRKTLYALCLTSRLFRALAQPLLFQTVYLCEGGQHRKFLQSITKGPHLAECVKTLVIAEGQTHYPRKIYRAHESRKSQLSPDHGSAPRSPRRVKRHRDDLEKVQAELSTLTTASTPLSPANNTGDRTTTHGPDTTRDTWVKLGIALSDSRCHLSEMSRMGYMRRLEISIRQHDERFADIFGAERSGNREAAVELVALLISLPNLKLFRWIGRNTSGDVDGIPRYSIPWFPIYQTDSLQMLFFAFIRLAPKLGLGLFDTVEELNFVHRAGIFNSLISDVMHLPRLRAFSIRCYDYGSQTFNYSSSLSKIRDLKIAVPYLDAQFLAAALPKIERLEILHYQVDDPSYLAPGPISPFDAFISAVQTHKAVLKELHFMLFPTIPRRPQFIGLHPWSLASFPALAALRVPDLLLYDTQVDAEWGDPRAMLPPSLRSLTVIAWFRPHQMAGFLRNMIHQSGSLTELHRLDVLDYSGRTPTLASSEPGREFTVDGVAYRVPLGFFLEVDQMGNLS